MNGQKLKVVDKHTDDEVTARIANANVAFGRLRANVWEQNGIEFNTKLKVYEAVVLPTIETWTVYERHTKRPNHFHLSCLRKLLKQMARQVPDTEFLKIAGMHSLSLKASTDKMDWPYYKNACLMRDFQRKFSMENYRRESALMVTKRNATKTPSKPP